MYELARADITKIQRPGGLNNRYVFSHHSGVWKPEGKV